MIGWLDTLQRLRRDNEPCVLVTIAATRGSTPREAGAKMVVTANQSIGTIGGGHLEYRCIQTACEWLRPGQERGARSRFERVTLGPNCGQCCGGVVDVLYEEIGVEADGWLSDLARCQADGTPAAIVSVAKSRRVAAKGIVTADDEFTAHGALFDADVVRRARRALLGSATAHCVDDAQGRPVLIEPLLASVFRIAIFGAGHVGRACARVLATLDAEVVLYDTRAHFVTDVTAGDAAVRSQLFSDPAACVATLAADSWCLIMTHDHGLDLELCARIVERGDSAFCGLIGSRSKRRRFFKRLRALGLDEAQLATLTCPLGDGHIRSKQPAAIAIAVAAQLLERREAVEKVARRPMALVGPRRRGSGHGPE